MTLYNWRGMMNGDRSVAQLSELFQKNRTVQKRRTANFRDDETRLLIQLWGNPVIQNQINSHHRKGPIMIQIAAAMQQHGYRRTPEEIHTRIRNLKCIYHRIKRAVYSGVLGPETTDWHHFKALDDILGRSWTNSLRPNTVQGNNLHAKIKREPESEVPDSISSNLPDSVNNSGSGLEEDSNNSAEHSATPSPTQGVVISSSSSSAAPEGHVAVGLTNRLTCASFANIKQISSVKSPSPERQFPESCKALPFIASSDDSPEENVDEDHYYSQYNDQHTSQEGNDLQGLLHQLLDLEREHLSIEKQRLELDRQIGAQLLTLVPVVGSILQKHLVSQMSSNDQG